MVALEFMEMLQRNKILTLMDMLLPIIGVFIILACAEWHSKYKERKAKTQKADAK